MTGEKLDMVGENRSTEMENETTTLFLPCLDA